jgi:hypothetical protein
LRSAGGVLTRLACLLARLKLWNREALPFSGCPDDG